MFTHLIIQRASYYPFNKNRRYGYKRSGGWSIISPFLKWIFLCCWPGLLINNIAQAQTDSNSDKPLFSTGILMHTGSIFAHSEAVENTAGSRPKGIELNFVWQKISQQVWDNCHCYPRMGLSVSYVDFDNRVLGSGWQSAFFLEPTFRLNRWWFLTLRSVAGVSFATKPYHPLKNPGNQSYSTSLNAYLVLGPGSQFSLSKRWMMAYYLNYQHISNGGVKDPNKGVNWITHTAGLFYTPENRPLPKRPKKFFHRKTPWIPALLVFASSKTARVGDKRRHEIVGGGLQLSKQLGRLNGLVSGFELYRDASLQQRMKNDQVEGSAWRSGILAGHQFYLGRFRFSQQIGVYLYNNNPYFAPWYHRWGLNYLPGKQWSVGFSLKAHKHVANFFDIRMTYHFL